MEQDKMFNKESYEQIILANAVEDFLTKLLKDYCEEYYVDISIGNDNPDNLIVPITKTFRGKKQSIE